MKCCIGLSNREYYLSQELYIMIQTESPLNITVNNHLDPKKFPSGEFSGTAAIKEGVQKF